MAERTRPSTSSPGLTGADVERQLEGRAELIAVARRRYAELEALLSGRRWRRGLLRRPELVPALVAHAEALREALERVQRRAAVEAWSEDTSVLREARELSVRRERLIGLAQRRLEALAVAPAHLSLEETLTRLEALVRQPMAWELNPGEVLVFETDARWHPRGRQGRALLPGDGLSLRQRAAPLARSVLWPLVRPVVWPFLGSGRLRITSERVLWLPVFGELQEVRLGTIAEEGIRLEPGSLGLRVVGNRLLRARGMTDAEEVAALLELHRQAPLRGAARSGVRLESVAIFPAKLGRLPGQAVLRPRGVSFIPAGQGPGALSAVTGKATSLRGFDAAPVLEALRWLPEAEFDACLARVVDATGGQSWAAGDTRYVAGPPVWRELRIEHGGDALVGKVEWAQEAAAGRLLREWPQALPSGQE
ncbi:hypothetical protein [Corallococcus llansteffanensis]|uniref:Uncharacterized protein n=1 Tax=Corallococcus llansteffanensis TaxID=2316731 RepID=A0A3A8P6E3_9BACT|nr:hypothetical protein [Corallococcus llansteffanensis]RKH50990.1 hypothetical protein D7V93_29815 [Corallococcus llansteffanensis]